MDRIEKEAYEIYQKYGKSGVCVFAGWRGIEKRGYCKGCEDETPIYKNNCLVCGQGVKTE